MFTYSYSRASPCYVITCRLANPSYSLLRKRFAFPLNCTAFYASPNLSCHHIPGVLPVYRTRHSAVLLAFYLSSSRIKRLLPQSQPKTSH